MAARNDAVAQPPDPPSEAELNDASIPPLVGGIPAGPKPAVFAPRTTTNPGTLFQSAINAPAINVWYNTNQTFGPNGDPQKWVNIVGNVVSAAPITSLTYSLNGGPAKNLSVGPNSSRLIRNGDFNIEIDYTDLQIGSNTVNIVATDNAAGVTSAPITVNYQAHSGNWTPQVYTIDWSTATKVNDVAQVIDGNWVINAGKPRPVSLADTGFDRLIAVGDISWRDYTVTVPITIHSLDLNKSPGVGVIVRWQGHFDNGSGLQPVTGWKRLGVLAWYRYEKATLTEGLQLLGNGGATLGTTGFTLTPGKTYIYKVGITSNADPSKPATYRFRIWDSAQTEPATWNLESTGIAGEPRNGSIVLVAHHADVSIGNVTVNLLNTEPKPELTVSAMGTGNGTVSANPNKATYRFGEDVTLTATPSGGSTFAGWQGDATGTANPTTIEMFGDKNVKAQFSDPNVQTPISDDFNGCGLNDQLWTFVNPLGDGTLAMTGAHAEIGVPAGSAHDIWTGGLNSPRIMQIAEDENFEFVVKFESTMSAKNQAQGVLVQGDSENFIRYNFLHDGTSYKIQAYTFTDGTPTAKRNENITVGTQMYLRVKRLGDVWNLFYSPDGSTWTLAAGFNLPLTVSSYGVYAGNSSQNPAHTAKVDYFFNTGSPIAPEDNTRKLTVTTTGSGTVERSVVKENYACNEVVTLTPVPAQGFKFDSWTGDLTGSANPAQVTMNATKNIVANFVPDVQYTLAVSSNDPSKGTVSKSPDKAFYGEGEQVTLMATPSLGNMFANWSGDANGSTTSLVVTVNKNMVVVGNFTTAPPRTLTVTLDGNGTVTNNPLGDPPGTYLHGQVVTLTAVPGVDATFAGWSGAATGLTNPVQVVMDGDKNVTATFLNDIYTLELLAAPSGTGTITADPPKDKYYDGEIVELTPVPAAGYKFANWAGGLEGNAVPGQLTMTNNMTVTANFIPSDTFTITTLINGGSGTVLKNPQKTEYNYNDIVTLTALPGSGFEFSGWSGDLVSTANPATVTVTKDLVITANFVAEGIYSLTILPTTNGSVTVDPIRDLYSPNQQVTLTAEPALGYIFSGWGGDALGSVNPLVITMTKNTTISADFIVAPIYDLSVTANGPGSVTIDPLGTEFTAGTTVTLTAMAESGYVFTGWSGDLVSSINPYHLLMNSDKVIVANFGEAADVVSDDFDGCGTLNPMWQWVDPLGQATYELTGTQAKITIPPGFNYEIWKTGNNSARLVQEVANTNFEIIAKLDSPVTQGFQTQGILIETDNDTFLRADFHHNGEEMRFFAATLDNGSSKNRFSETLTPPPSGEVYVRIQRNGDTWRLFYRFSESDPWIGFKGNNFKFAMDVSRVGIFASSQPTGGQPAPGHTALFDFFFNADAAITPEDVNAPAIAVTKVGEGSVALTPNGPTYACGQQVELRATPATGWQFLNWSVDLNGSSPTKILTVTKKHNVTATFIPRDVFELFLPISIR